MTKFFFPRPITSLYVDGKIYPFDNALRVLRFPKLPLVAKLRFGLVTLYLRLTKNWHALEKENCSQLAYPSGWRADLSHFY